VKCTGDKDGCQRCFESNTQCFYSKSSRSKSAPKENGPELLRPTSTPQNTPDLDASGTLQGIGLSDMASAFGLPNTNHIETVDYIGDINNIDDMETDFMAGGAFDLGVVFSPNMELSNSDPMISGSHNGKVGDCPEPSDTMINGSSRCPCAEIMRIYEKAEIYLVWSLRGRSATISLGPDELLQCQKEVLSSCESILNCDKCSLQPEQAMMIISIFEKVRASIIEMSGMSILPDLEDDGRETRYVDNNSFSRQRRDTFPEFTKSTSLDDHGNYGNGGGEIVSSARGGYKRKSLLFNSGDWNVDNEDKMHMLKCLINVRATRLIELSNRLDKVALENNWLVHRSILKDLSERFVQHKVS